MLRFQRVAVFLAISLGALEPASVSALNLTDLTVTSTDSLGNRGPHTWNTLPASGVGDTHNLWIAGPNLNDSFINGPLNSQVPISIALPSGVHTFSIFADQHSVSDFTTPFVINLFFEDEQDAPGISAVAPIDLSTTGPDPPFSAFAGTTSTVQGTSVAGANSLTAFMGQEMIQLMTFRWSHPDVEQLNRVSTYEAFPNGEHRDDGNDFVAQFTVAVTSITEPSTFTLTALTLLGLAYSRRRRLRQA